MSKWEPASFTHSVLQYGPETCQHRPSALNSITQKPTPALCTEWSFTMELAKRAAVTHHPREQTIPQLCHRGSTTHCSLTEWWFGLSGAGKQSHIPEEGKKPEREGVALLGLRLRFPAGPSKHPRAPLWPGHQAGYLAAIIWQGYDVLLWSFKANLQLIHKH